MARLTVNAWCCLAAHAAHHEDFVAADSAVRAAASLAASTGDPALVALARDVDGHVASYLKDHDRALAAKLSGLVDARAAGDDTTSSTSSPTSATSCSAWAAPTRPSRTSTKPSTSPARSTRARS